MKTLPLSKTDKECLGVDVLVKVYGTDIAALAGGTGTPGVLPLFSYPAGATGELVRMVVRTPLTFSAAHTTTSVTVAVGDGDSATVLMPAAETLGAHASDVVYGKPVGAKKTYEVADTVDATFTQTGTSALFSECTGGEVLFYLRVDLPEMFPTA